MASSAGSMPAGSPRRRRHHGNAPCFVAESRPAQSSSTSGGRRHSTTRPEVARSREIAETVASDTATSASALPSASVLS